MKPRLSWRGVGRAAPPQAVAWGASLAAALWLVIAFAAGPRPAAIPSLPTSAEEAGVAPLAANPPDVTHLEAAPTRAHVPAAAPLPELPRSSGSEVRGLDLALACGLGPDAPVALPARPGLTLALAVGLRPPPRLDPPPLAPSAPTRAARGPPSSQHGV